MATFDEYGRQVPDPRPVEVHTDLRISPTLQEEIQRYVRSELSRRARDAGYETLDEANDFDVDDDLDEFLDFTEYTVRELTLEAGDRDASRDGPSIREPATPEPTAPEGADSGAQPSK